MSLPVDFVRATETLDHTRRPADSRLNRMARRAHEIYQARGGENGRALEDWLRAEEEIDWESGCDPVGSSTVATRSSGAT
jgi:Protein of unknown function (DUF2934)